MFTTRCYSTRVEREELPVTRRPAKVLTQIYKSLRRGNEMIVKVTWGRTIDGSHRPSCLGAVAVVGKAGGLRARRSGGSGSLSFTQRSDRRRYTLGW